LANSVNPAPLVDPFVDPFVAPCSHLCPEYKQFELKVFTQCIYQEIRRNKFINWCNKKRQEKEEEHAENCHKRDYMFD
jgi:hypothetical protein